MRAGVLLFAWIQIFFEHLANLAGTVPLFGRLGCGRQLATASWKRDIESTGLSVFRWAIGPSGPWEAEDIIHDSAGEDHGISALGTEPPRAASVSTCVESGG